MLRTLFTLSGVAALTFKTTEPEPYTRSQQPPAIGQVPNSPHLTTELYSRLIQKLASNQNSLAKLSTEL